MKFHAWQAMCLAVCILFAPLAMGDSEEVNLYSARKERLIAPLLDQFTEATGITVNLVTGSASALIKRLAAEGRNTPADLLLTTDAGRLHVAAEKDLLQAAVSPTIAEQVPAHLRHTDNLWIGLSLRARVVIYNPERIEAASLSTYEDLADPKWRGKLCVRTSDNIYNQSLLASIIAHLGAEQAEAWAQGIVANMARKPKGNERAQVTAVATGECDVAIVNNYYVGNMLLSADARQSEAARQVRVFYPNQDGRGVHVNVSGIGITQHARNRDNALRLIEFLLSDQAQQWYAQTNVEYPIRDSIAVSDIIQGWGYPFKQDTLPMARLGELNGDAVRTFDRAGWR